MVRFLTVLAVAALGVVTVAGAQMELGVMQGTITDDGGRPLEGATVRLRDLERGRETTFKSDKNGRFYRRGLPAVEYEMVVEKDGYQPVKDKVKLVAGTDRRFDFTSTARSFGAFPPPPRTVQPSSGFIRTSRPSCSRMAA